MLNANSMLSVVAAVGVARVLNSWMRTPQIAA